MQNGKNSDNFTVLFDAEPIAANAEYGPGYYAYGLIEALADKHPEVTFVGHYYDFLGRRKEPDLPRAGNISYRRTVLFPAGVTKLLRRLGLELYFELLIKQRGDFIIFADYLTLPSRNKTPMTVVIHDLAYLDSPDTLPRRYLRDLRRFVPRSLDRANFVTAVTQTTRQRLRQTYSFEAPVLATTAPPVKAVRVPEKLSITLLKKMNIYQKFILFVGTPETSENLSRLLEAYLSLPETIRNAYRLVLAGDQGWVNDELEAEIGDAKHQGYGVIAPGALDAEQRAALYQHASLFVFPTFYEGFAEPPLEAVSYGVPVLCSDTPALREVFGDTAAYCDPEWPDGISIAMLKLLRSQAERDALAQAAKARMRRVSWDDITDELFEMM